MARLAWMVAVGIGLHNLGEGLAVGAAITTGELAFGIAAGAIAQVIWAVLVWLRQKQVALTPATAGAFAGALGFLYLTGVAAG